MHRAVKKLAFAAFWQHLSLSKDESYHEAVTELRAAKLSCQAERNEKRLTKYLKHPEWSSFEKHIRLLMHAKDLHLIPKKKLTRYREAVYQMRGK